MAIVTRATLKGYFETGDIPTQAQFIDLIDTLLEDNSGARIKTAYEGEDDTNEFSNAEQTKVTNAFVKNVDDSDNITESSDKKFLDSSGAQIVAGIKEFSNLVHANNAANATKTFTATPTFAFGTDGNTHQMTLTGNVTTFATSGEVGSANMDVYLINDGTAGRTVAAPTGWTADPTSETHTTAANAINRYQFYTLPDGSKYFNLHIVKE